MRQEVDTCFCNCLTKGAIAHLFGTRFARENFALAPSFQIAHLTLYEREV